jgi:hypothetical protein
LRPARAHPRIPKRSGLFDDTVILRIGNAETNRTTSVYNAKWKGKESIRHGDQGDFKYFRIKEA